MKRFLILIVSIFITFSLFGCDDTKEEIKDFNAVVIEEVVTSTSITVHALVTEEVSTLTALAYIANDIAVSVYGRNIEEIELNSMTLIIHLYASQADFDSEEASYGSLSFTINENASKPGLSEGSNNLHLNA